MTTDECISLLMAKCRRFKTRSLKTIRMNMDDIAILLARNQDCTERIKVIHLLRDPRGIANSRRQIKAFAPGGYREFCPQIYEDIQLRKKLEKRYKNTFLELFYEEVAKDPVKMANKVYDFTGKKNVPDSVLRWFKYSAQNKTAEYHRFQPVRKNSTETSMAWKTQLERCVLETIERACADLIDYMYWEPT